MADRLTPEQRSAHMARIRRANTKPELVARQLLHGLGYRFRIQFGEVPGRPDIAFPARRRCVQVHAASGMPTAAACPGHHPPAPSSGRRSSRAIASGTNGSSVTRPHLAGTRSEEHTSELQSLMRISYAVFCLKKKK